MPALSARVGPRRIIVPGPISGPWGRRSSATASSTTVTW
jgi:hypothetical protein